MSIKQFIQTANLEGAINTATAEVKRLPLQAEARIVLSELMCFTGNLDRADTLLDSAAKLQTVPSTGIHLLRQLMRGEMARQQWYQEGKAPLTRSETSPELSSAFQAIVEFRAGHLPDVARILGSLAEGPALAGTVTLETESTQSFDVFRDLGDLTATVAELISPTGKFYWVPWREFKKVEFEPVKSLRDVLWRPVQCTFHQGLVEQYFMPCLYHGTSASTNDEFRLGQATDWKDCGENLIQGVGLRMFLAGELTPTILEIRSIDFE